MTDRQRDRLCFRVTANGHSFWVNDSTLCLTPEVLIAGSGLVGCRAQDSGRRKRGFSAKIKIFFDHSSVPTIVTLLSARRGSPRRIRSGVREVFARHPRYRGAFGSPRVTRRIARLRAPARHPPNIPPRRFNCHLRTTRSPGYGLRPTRDTRRARSLTAPRFPAAGHLGKAVEGEIGTKKTRSWCVHACFPPRSPPPRRESTNLARAFAREGSHRGEESIRTNNPPVRFSNRTALRSTAPRRFLPKPTRLCVGLKPDALPRALPCAPQSWADDSDGALPRVPHAFGAFANVGPRAGTNGFGPPGGFAGAAAGGPAGIFTSGSGPPGPSLSFGTGVGVGVGAPREREPPNYAFGGGSGSGAHENPGSTSTWGNPGAGLGMRAPFGAPGTQPIGRSAVGVGAPGGRPLGAPLGAVGGAVGQAQVPQMGLGGSLAGGGAAGGGTGLEPSSARGSNDETRPLAQHPRPVLPMPTSPPFTAFVGNFPYECSQEEVVGLFTADACAVADVRMVRNRDTDRPRGYFLEFEDLASLERALGFDQYVLGGRPLRVNVAEGRPERRDRDRDRDRYGPGGGFAERYNADRGGDRGGNRGVGVGAGDGGGGGPPGSFGPGPPGASFGRREGGGGYQEAREGRAGRRGDEVREPRRRSFDRPADRVAPPDGPAPEGRKKLVLAARSVPTGSHSTAPAGSAEDASAPSKPDPFGGARPVDSSAKLAEAERKIKEEKEALHSRSARLIVGETGAGGLPAPKPKPLSRSSATPPVAKRSLLIAPPKDAPVISAKNAFELLSMDEEDGEEEEE